MSKEFARRQFIKGALTMAGSGLGAGLVGVGVEDYFKSKELQTQAESLKDTGMITDARISQKQSDWLARRAIVAAVPGAALFITSVGVTIKELK